MGELLEIDFICQKQISCQILLNLFSDYMHTEYKVNEIEIMDNWQYENVININDENTIWNYVNSGKIVNLNAKANNINIGLQLELLKGKYIGDIWIDTTSFNNEELNDFLKILLSKLDTLFVTYGINVVAIGMETIFYPDDEYDEMMNLSHGIIYWMFPKDSYYNDNYEVTELDKSIIFKIKDI